MRTVRAVTHVHSTWSYDGHWELARIARAFGRRGCAAVLTSEHDRGWSEDRLLQYREACARASTSRVLLVPGVEYSDPANLVHVLVWGKVPFLGEGLVTGELLRRVREHGGYAVWAHPWRKAAAEGYDAGWATTLRGIEVWNRKSDGWSPEPRAAHLAATASLAPFTSLDFHRRRQLFPLRMLLDIDGELTEDAVVAALWAGRTRTRVAGLPALPFTFGAGLRAAEGADALRRATLRTVRSVRTAAGRRRPG